jgi:hypothetical protein
MQNSTLHRYCKITSGNEIVKNQYFKLFREPDCYSTPFCHFHATRADSKIYKLPVYIASYPQNITISYMYLALLGKMLRIEVKKQIKFFCLLFTTSYFTIHYLLPTNVLIPLHKKPPFPVSRLLISIIYANSWSFLNSKTI